MSGIGSQNRLSGIGRQSLYCMYGIFLPAYYILYLMLPALMPRKLMKIKREQDAWSAIQRRPMW